MAIYIHECVVNTLYTTMYTKKTKELNIRTLNLTSDEATYVSTRAEPDKAKLGARLRGDFGKVAAAIASTCCAVLIIVLVIVVVRLLH